MKLSDIRKEARLGLTGKWGKGALITLIYVLIVLAIEALTRIVPIVATIATYVIMVPIVYGLTVSFMKLKRGEEVSCIDFLTDGFSSFGKAWAVIGNVLLKLIIPIITNVVSSVIFIGGILVYVIFSLMNVKGASFDSGMCNVILIISLIGGVVWVISYIWMLVKGYYYSLSLYILKDHKEMTGREIVTKSAEMMKGYRWKYFCLSLSFIGWAILAIIPFGIGLFWLIPYIQTAQVIFYEDRAGILNEKKEVVTETERLEEN